MKMLETKLCIENLFKNSLKFSDSDGNLDIPKILESIEKIDLELIKILKDNENARKLFFSQIDDIYILNQNKLIEFFMLNDYMKNRSYTAYTNKIGLIKKDGFIKKFDDVVLAFPHKDCVLEAGQTKDDDKKKEILYNEIISSDEIDRLFEPKVLTNIKKYSKDGLEDNPIINDSDNLIIKGNNLLTLHSLKKKFAKDGGKVKLIYIDPPYNTGSDSFGYNDNFNHSTWLTFMKNRLEIAKEFLTEDGVIFINLDDNESHYCKILCDEIFNRQNFIANIIWQKKYSPSNDAKWFSDNHDHILVFAKNKEIFRPNLLPRTVEMNKRYSNPDNDPRGDWKPGGFSVKTYSKDYDYPIETPSGKIVNPPKGSCWQTSKENFLKKLADNRIYFGKNNDAKPQIKQFLDEVQQGIVAKTIWLHDEVGHNQISRSEIVKLFGEFTFSTPKPESLLKRIIELTTKPNDLIMDYHLGSGTTCAVAHKMGRRYIGIEQMDYIEDVAVERLKKVINGEQGGISKIVNWNGGGDFVYAELKTIDTFKNVEIGSLNRNMQYLPINEIEDSNYNISKEEIAINKAFYGIENE
jgi:adenine-specific DNA-methyltransferase